MPAVAPRSTSILPQSAAVRAVLFIAVVAAAVFGLVALGREDIEFRPILTWTFAHYVLATVGALVIGLLTPARGASKDDLVLSELGKLIRSLVIVAFGLAMVDVRLGSLIALPFAMPMMALILVFEAIGSIVRAWDSTKMPTPANDNHDTDGAESVEPEHRAAA